MDAVFIPRFLDQEERLFIFTRMDLAALIGPFALLLPLQQAGVGLLLGFGMVGLTRLLKRKGMLGNLRELAYWYFPASLLKFAGVKIEAMPPSHFRVLAG